MLSIRSDLDRPSRVDAAYRNRRIVSPIGVCLIGVFLYISQTQREAHYALAIVICLAAALLGSGKFLVTMKWTWPLWLLIAVSGFVGFAVDSDGYDMVRGLWYLSRPIVYVALGAVLVTRAPKETVMGIVFAGVALSIDYIIRYYYFGGDFSSRYAVRQQLGYGTWLQATAAAILFIAFVRGRGFNISRRSAGLLLVVPVVAVVLSESRSIPVVAAVLVIVGLLSPRAVGIAVRAVPAMAILLFVVSTPLLQIFVPLSELRQFLWSAPDYVNEMISLPRTNSTEISAYWRSFETQYSFSYVESAGDTAVIFGRGMGASVPLSFRIGLGGSQISDLPVFHNGYTFLFVKGGVLGLFCYLLFVIFTSASIRRALAAQIVGEAGDRAEWLRMGVGMLLCSVSAMSTVGGLFNIEEPGATSCAIVGGALAVALSRGRPPVAAGVQS